MPPLPEVAIQVLALADDPEYSTEDLASIIRTDPSLTARLLKLGNSSIFPASAPTTTIAAAVNRLGMRNVVHVAVAACSTTWFDRGTRQAGLVDSSSIWRHALACGSAAELLADHSGLGRPGAAFTAGVLHDIGKVVLASQLDCVVDAVPARQGESLIDYERRVLGMDHATVAGFVLERWPVPVEFRRAIVNHHDPAKLRNDPPLTAIVHVGDLMVLRAGVGVPADGLELDYLPEALEMLGLDTTGADSLAPRFLTELAQIEAMLAI